MVLAIKDDSANDLSRGIRNSFRKAPRKNAGKSIRSSVTGFDPRAVITGIILEEQLPPGLELIIGGKTDPSFGKVITLGMGGKLVELLNDISIRVLPLEDEEIQEMIRELRGYRLIRGFRGEVTKDEEALLHLVRAVAGMFREDPRIEEFDINPVILYGRGGCAVDARIYRADTPAQGETTAPVTMAGDLLDIRSIAVVGASQDPNKVGYAICRNLLTFPGDLYPVNPKGGMILGRKAYPTLASIPGKVDAVVITIPAYGVPQIVGEAGEKGIPLAIIISSGFREIGEAGRLIEEDVLAIARRYGVRIMGPNCLGVMLPLRGINMTFDPVSPKPGKIAFISQSGALITTLVDWSRSRDPGWR